MLNNITQCVYSQIQKKDNLKGFMFCITKFQLVDSDSQEVEQKLF